MDKTQKVLEHLREKGSITSWEAIKEYGATRLSAIIFNLKEKGFEINTEMEEFTDRYGDKSRYGRYYLVGEPDETNKE